MTPDEIYAMCRTDSGRDEYCKRFATTKWLVRKTERDAAVLIGRSFAVSLATPDAGERFRIVTGLEHGKNYDTVHVAEVHALSLAEDEPDKWYIVDDRDEAELERIYKLND